MRLLLPVLLAILLPISLLLWLGNLVLHALNSNDTFGNGPWDPLSPSRIVFALCVPFYIARKGIAKGSLNQSGAIAGIAIGFIMTISNYCFFASLLTFFISGSRATKFRQNKKVKLEDDFQEGGKRNWVQVICNGGPAAQVAVLFMLEVGCGEPLIDFTHNFNVSWLCMAVLGSLACANGDTFASEIGIVSDWGQPRLITTLRKVPPGTNGGISLVGTISSFVGGLFVGGAYHAALSLLADVDLLEKAPPQWPIILLGGIAGLLGSFVDSVLGATLQYSGYHEEKKCVVETPGKGVTHISGVNVFDNHSINLLSTAVLALLTPQIAILIWGIV